jgi:hypothetical protein
MNTPSEEGVPYAHLEKLLQKNLEVSEANHKILRRMERNALIGFVFKVIIWLLVLGVPIFFLSTYIAPLLSTVTGDTTSQGLFGLPSVEQLKGLLEMYRVQQ